MCKCLSKFAGDTCNIGKLTQMLDHTLYSLYFTVVRSAFKPQITNQPQNTTSQLFSTVRLTCVAEGYPEPEIHWYKDGKLLESSSASTNLVIEELRPNNRGFYYCEAVNTAGTARSHTVLVNIKGLYSMDADQFLCIYMLDVVQYEAFILQNETTEIDAENLLQRVF